MDAQMIRLFFLAVLLAYTSLSTAADLKEPFCNARRLLIGRDGTIPKIDKTNPLFSSPTFEKNCYALAKKLIRSSTGYDNNLEEVEGILETILMVNPESIYPHLGAAELQMRKRELQLAADSLYQTYQEARIATRIKPVLSESFVTLGRVELMMNCLPCAAMSVKKAKELRNSSPELAMLVASIDEIQRNYSDAKYELVKALSTPSSGLTKEIEIDIHLRLSALSALLKNNVDAEKELDRAIAVDTESPIPYLAKAEFLLFWIGDDIAATKAAIKANQVKPTIEAKRVQSFSEYLTWAKEYLGGGKTKNIRRIMQTSYVSPEEVFVGSAKHTGLSKITEAMLKAKVINNIEVQDGQGNTVLITASAGNNIHLVQLLFNQHANANANAQNSNGERALSFFVLNGNHKAITMILDSGAEVNYVDVNGSSPLTLAVFRQDKFIIDQLLNHGASMQPVIDMAKRLGIADIEKLVSNLKPASI